MLSKLFSITLLFLSLWLTSINAHANVCLDLFNVQPTRIRQSTADRINVSYFTAPNGKSEWVRLYHSSLKDERNRPILMFEAQLEKATGKMTFSVLTRNEETKEHYDSEVFAQSLFWLAVQNFGADRIQIIVGDWVIGKRQFYDPSLPYSTNTGMYYNNLAKGMSTTEAAKETWTGRLAVQLGLKSVELIGIEDTGLLQSLIVHFTRP